MTYQPIIRSLVLTLTVVMILLAGCASPDQAGDPNAGLTVTDALERSVSFDSPPDRIVIAGKANFFLNDALYIFPSAPERVVGLTEAKQTTRPFLSFLDPDYEEKTRFTVASTAEEIATAQPDLVVLKSFMRESVGRALEELSIPVVYLEFETPDQYQRDLATLGVIFDNPTRADEIQGYYRDSVERITDPLDDVPDAERPEVLTLQYSTKGGDTAFLVPPERWMQSQMTALAGGQPVWSAYAQGGWTVVNLEQIAAWNPDVIFVISYFDPIGEVVTQLRSDPEWQALDAVKNDALYGFPGDFYSWDQPDTRWILGMTWMAKQIYPERFADIDMRAELSTFYRALYQIEEETVESEILPLVKGDITLP